MKKSTLIVLLATSFVLLTKTAQANPCETENNTAEILKCANLEYQEVDKKLNNFWNKSPGYVRYKFGKSQKNWLEYREDFCTDKANKVAGEEIIKAITLLRCKTTLTKKRIEYFDGIFN